MEFLEGKCAEIIKEIEMTSLEGGKASRTFTVVSCSVGKAGGRYAGISPMAAAKKAAIKRLSDSVSKMNITIRETGSKNKKELSYTVVRGKDSKVVITKK